jgi:S-formylglutathione hydrolase FrmB
MALIHASIRSHVLGMLTSIDVILPQPRAEDLRTPARARAAAARRHPTLYLLHGLSDDHSVWPRWSSIERYVDGLDLAVVMPATARGFYTDMAHGPRYWTYISEELPAVARSLFPLSEASQDNFVAGLSMGGYGAMKLALRCPRRFAAAASLSGSLDMVGQHDGATPAEWHTELEGIFGDLGKLRGSDNDLMHLAARLACSRGPRPALFQCCGTEDFLYQDNLRFRDHARKLGLNLTYEEGPGTHEWGYWDRMIQRVLEWLPLKKRSE